MCLIFIDSVNEKNMRKTLLLQADVNCKFFSGSHLIIWSLERQSCKTIILKGQLEIKHFNEIVDDGLRENGAAAVGD